MTERKIIDFPDGGVAHEGTALILSTDERSRHGVNLTCSLPKHPKGHILLAGSGPSHPSLLTIATHTALTKPANIVVRVCLDIATASVHQHIRFSVRCNPPFVPRTTYDQSG